MDELRTAITNAFGLSNAEITLKGRGQAQNEVYVVEADGGKWIAKHYGIYYKSRLDWVRFEVRLLNHLKTRGLPIAAPLNLKSQESFLLIEDRPLILFEWADGVIEWPASPSNADRLGVALASMHQLTDDLQLDGTERRYGIEEIIDTPVRLLLPFLADRPDLQNALEKYADEYRFHLKNVPLGSPAFGPIHGDLHQGNCFFQEERLKIFDFSLAGVGYRTFDLTGFLWPLRDRTVEDPKMRACCDSFLSGYERVRPLTPEERAAVPVFVQLRSLWELGDWIDSGTGSQAPAEVVNGIECLLTQFERGPRISTAGT